MGETELKVFILVDNSDGEKKYVSDNSIRKNKKTKQQYYVYSSRLNNGFNTYICESQAQKQLAKLQDIAKEIGFEREFCIEEIDLYQALLSEQSLPKNDYPFITEEIKGVKATSVA